MVAYCNWVCQTSQQLNAKFISGEVSPRAKHFGYVSCSSQSRNQEFNRWKPPNDRTPGSSRRNLLSSDPPGLGKFKPPPLPIPGIFTPPVEFTQESELQSARETKDAEEKRKQVEIDCLLNIVRDGTGTWQEQAQAVEKLQQGGLNTERIYEATYVSYDKQTAMVVAGQVYRSLIEEGVSESITSSLNADKIFHLYALRTLSARQRKTAVEYLMENSLDSGDVQDLAKAIKDHERRPQGREGFTSAPGDCLAFALHRAALESKDKATRAKAMEQAMAVASSPSARGRLQELVDSEDSEE